jgi:hypothetical protein
MRKQFFVTIWVSLLLTSCSNTYVNKSNLIFFKAPPPKEGENRVYPLALTYGYLVLENNCLYLTNDKSSDKKLRILSWPWNYSFKKSKTGTHILDGNKRVIAKVGSLVKFGGAGNSIENGSFKLQQKFKVCNNSNVVGYWGVSPNFKQPLSFKPSKTRKSLQKFIKNSN